MELKHKLEKQLFEPYLKNKQKVSANIHHKCTISFQFYQQLLFPFLKIHNLWKHFLFSESRQDRSTSKHCPFFFPHTELAVWIIVFASVATASLRKWWYKTRQSIKERMRWLPFKVLWQEHTHLDSVSLISV